MNKKYLTTKNKNKRLETILISGRFHTQKTERASGRDAYIIYA